MADVAIDPVFQRDSELYRVISRAQFRPVVWKIKPGEGAELAAYLAGLFSFEPLAKVEADADKHAPLFRAIKRGSRP